MSEEDSIERRPGIDRRKFIAGVGTGMAAGLAGCGGGGGPATAPATEAETTAGGETPTETTATPTATETPTPEQEFVRGGRPIIGQAQPPQHLNVMKGGNNYGTMILGKLYTFGSRDHPKTVKPIPWAFKSWTLNTDNIKENPSDPAIVAELRDGLTFHDGKKITAEDAKFTYEYMMNQPTTGYYQASPEVVEVGMDKAKGTTVSFFMKAETAFWNTAILQYPILPKHVWKNVSDYTKYSPREEGGIVGSGFMTLKDFSWPNWVELEMRPREEIPYNKDDQYGWLHPEGPFVDGLRFELFQSRSSLFQAILDGKVDLPLQSVTLDQAVKANNSKNHHIKQAIESDYAFHSFNQRRVPLDDVAFRQFLAKALNQKWLIEENFQNIGAIKGTYPTSPIYKDWRPPEPSELRENDDPYNIGEYEGISIPDLDWPSDTLKYGENTRKQDIDALREFLINHPDAKHDYSLGKARSGKVDSPDGQAIYVNGKPIGEAHTNNAGEPGQGPIEMSQGPPEGDPLAYPRADAWIKALKRIGVPIKRTIEPWETQYPKVYLKEDFDMYEQDWGDSLQWPQTHIEWMFHSSWADLKQGDDDDDIAQWNSMAYTGADDLISKAMGMMDHEKRKPIVKKAYAKLYRDVPHMVTSTYVALFPATNDVTGIVAANSEGPATYSTALNIRKNPNA